MAGDAMDSDGQKPAARRYKSKQQRPCDFCRRRRSACRIDAEPPCGLCRSYGRECTFDEAPPPRRKPPPPGLTVSDAGSNDGGMSQDGSASRAADDFMSMSVSMLQPGSPVAGMPLDGVAVAVASGVLDDNDAPGQFMDTTGPLDFGDMALLNPMQYAQTLMPSLDRSPGLCGLPNSKIVGPTDSLDPYLLRQYRFDSNGDITFKRLTMRSVVPGHNPVHFLITETGSGTGRGSLDDSIVSGGGGVREELDTLVAPQIGQRLLALYSEHVMPQFPVVSLDHEENGMELDPAVLAAIYIAAQNFALFDEDLCIQTVYDKPPISKLKDLVWGSLHNHRNQPNIPLLQSALLMALAPADHVLSPEVEERAMLAGMIAVMANALGLQHDPTGWNVPDREKAFRRRLSCLVRANDTWTAMAAGRPPLLSAENWAVEDVPASDLCTAVLSEPVLSTFVQYMQLTTIVGCIMQNAFSLRASTRLAADVSKTLQVTKPLMETLNDWYRGLAQSSARKQDAVINASAFLHLGYHATKTLLFRAIMRPFQNADYMQLPVDDQVEHESARRQVRIGLKSCALAFSSYIRELDPGDLQAFWPFWSVSAFALHPILWQTYYLSSGSAEEAWETKQGLMQARQLLRFRARSFDLLRLALLRVDSIWWRGIRETIYLSPTIEQNLAQDHLNASSATGHMQFQAHDGMLNERTT